MRDYCFGEKLFELRKMAGLTQSQMAQEFGVTNKAVSKWENGASKPNVNQMIKIAKFFGVPLEELIKNESKEKKVVKIAITGGPCSGKSTAMSWIQNEFTKKGYTVLFVPETATELLVGGFSPKYILNLEKYIIRLQMEKEKVFIDGAKDIATSDKILIVCDRGVLDCKAYMGEKEFTKTLGEFGLNEIEVRDSYDAVFHLVTAANGAEAFYSNGNNKARYETAEQARAIDEKTLYAWTGHPHLRIIDNKTNFRDKMRKLLSEISSFLGEPQPLEIERKFLIEYPPVKELEKMQNCKKSEIIQTYLHFEGGECRIRQRGDNGVFTYTKTIKKQVSDMSRIEVEERLSKEEYLSLLLDADENRRQIRKTRYCLIFDSQYFEIDVYPFWKDKAIMEIELRSETQEINIPEFIKVIKEVTGDKNYSNSAMAMLYK